MVQPNGRGVTRGYFERGELLIGVLEADQRAMQEYGAETDASIFGNDTYILNAAHKGRIEYPLDGAAGDRMDLGARLLDDEPSCLRREIASVDNVVHQLPTSGCVGQAREYYGVDFVAKAGPFRGGVQLQEAVPPWQKLKPRRQRRWFNEPMPQIDLHAESFEMRRDHPVGTGLTNSHCGQRFGPPFSHHDQHENAAGHQQQGPGRRLGNDLQKK